MWNSVRQPPNPASVSEQELFHPVTSLLLVWTLLESSNQTPSQLSNQV